ncbi:hypothetical protein ABTK74_19470, partial [Acinetobacter baumannii]
MNLNSSQLRELVIQYHQENYEVFEQLNDLFANSVVRAEKIRKEAQKHPETFMYPISGEKDPRNWETRLFATNEQELQGRWEERS